MKKNMGIFDRTIRISLAIVLLYLTFTSIIPQSWSILSFVFVAILLLTGFISFCPLYAILGYRTNKSQK